MRSILALMSFVGLFNATYATAENGPAVIELYTSQGCSSCPPADAMLHDLAKRDDVIALALHVDYWDYIGWKDSFASAEYTQRQHAYARAANATTVYTPQMVIGGVDHVIGSRPMQVMDVVQAHSRQGNPVDVELTRRGSNVFVSAAAGRGVLSPPLSPPRDPPLSAGLKVSSALDEDHTECGEGLVSGAGVCVPPAYVCNPVICAVYFL